MDICQILLCLAVFSYCGNAETYFVTPASNASCPGEPCLTLSEYAAQAPDYFSTETSMVFLEGEHVLSRSFSIRDIDELSFLGVSLQVQVKVSCFYEENFEIRSVQNVSISHLRFEECYGNIVTVAGSLLIENCLIRSESKNSRKTPFYLSDIQEAKILNSSFVSNQVTRNDTAIACAAVKVENSRMDMIHSEFEYNNALSTQLGSVLCAISSDVTMRGCRFTDNLALTGGVVYAEHSNITASGTVFANNHATKFGGVAYITSLSTFTIQECIFSENSCSSDGGGMYITNSMLKAVDCQFVHNNAQSGTGGVLRLTDNSIALFQNSHFVENWALNSGVVSSSSWQNTIQFLDTTFYDNKALSNNTDHGYGAVININGDISVFFTRCTFKNNYASTSGGCGHVANTSRVHISGPSVFENNTAIYGGAFTLAEGSTIDINIGNTSIACYTIIEFLNNSAEHGAALNVLDKSVARVHCTSFRYNRANRCSSPSECRGGAILARTDATLHFVDTDFYENTASGKGGVIFAQFSSIKTSGELILDSNKAGSGVMYLTSSSANITGESVFSKNKGSFLAHNSDIVFMGTTRFCGGASEVQDEGGAITAVRSTIEIFGNVFFENNHGIYGGALLANEGIIKNNSTCTFVNNSAVEGGAVYAYKSTFQFRASTIFKANNATESGGGIFALSSTLEYYSQDNAFINNQATNGGAIYFNHVSTLSIVKEIMECPRTQNIWYCKNDPQKWLNLTFEDNVALERGGAICVNDTNANSCDSLPFENNPTYQECFIQGIAVYESANDWAPQEVNYGNIYFSNNFASDGTVLYGGLLDRCAIDNFAEQKQILNTIPDPLTYFTDMSNGSFLYTDISSDPVRVCFCDNDTTNCTQNPPVIYVRSGQIFHLSVTVVNQVNESRSSEILAYLSSKSSRFGKDQAKQVVNNTCSRITYSIFTADFDETLFLYADGPCSDHGISRTDVKVIVDTNCPVGFAQSYSSLECECDPKIQSYITNCSIDTESVIREGNFWISSVKEDIIIIHNFCPYDYCFPSTFAVAVNLSDYEFGSDSQCAFNRSGRLCGSCREGYSMTLGSSMCMKCSNLWLLLIIPFSLAGIGLVVLMMACNLTLEAGTLNGLLFYANIVIANRAILFPFQKQNVLTVFVSMLGLNLGIATCFFDGMDAFSKMWVQISFELYLIFLAAIIVVLGESMKVANFFHKYKLNPVHTLATLLVLSYEKLSRKIFSLISYTKLEYPNETVSVWLFDPSLRYMEGKHISLAVVASLILLTGIFFNIVLLFSKCIISKSRSIKVNTFLESYHAPFKPNHKYWAGLLLLVRNISYFISEFLTAGGNPKFSINFIFALVTGILALKVLFVFTANFQPVMKKRSQGFEILEDSQESSSPSQNETCKGIVYENPAKDLLETSFLINLLVLTYFTLYIRDDEGEQSILFYVSSSIVFVTFLGILIYHMCLYSSLFNFVIKCVKNYLMRRKERLDKKSNNYGSTSNEVACLEI